MTEQVRSIDVHAGKATSGQLEEVKAQVAVIRTLLDEVERFVHMTQMAHSLGEQLVQEMDRLGCLLLGAASSVARALGEPGSEREEQSGVHAVRPTRAPFEKVDGPRK